MSDGGPPGGSTGPLGRAVAAAYRRPGVLAAALAALAGAAAVAVSVGVFPFHSVNHDEGVYLRQAAMLLEGRLFLRPPVEAVFRPWFFVDGPRGLYPKYAPLPAAVFAVGMALGVPRLSLALVGAAVVGGVYWATAEAFEAHPRAPTVADRRVALLSAALVAVSPLFLVQTALFLPYAPTTALNLAFAAAYLRANRLAGEQRRPAADGDAQAGSDRRVLGWAAVAGAAVGLAFFARPFTAVLFAAPFVGHALWTLRPGEETPTVAGVLDRAATRRQAVTAALGVGGVALALGYNAAVTGDPLVFPYEVFAPRDGPGFGERAILGYERDYDPALALRANAAVLGHLLVRWAPAGAVGSLLAAVGVAGLLRGRWRTGVSADDRRHLVAALLVTVPVGNVFFWGNLNVLGSLDVVADGLVWWLGPHYHFDLLWPLAAFGAVGALRTWGALAPRVRRIGAGGGDAPSAVARVALAALVVVGLVAPAAGAAAVPLADNRELSDRLATGYGPFEDGAPEDAVVFLPAPYGDWLGHPFQALRNDPGFDGPTVYALDERPFAVVDAYPDREYHRYVYRGEWAPTAGRSVDARLQRVEHVRANRVTVDVETAVPPGGERVSVRLAGADDDAAYFSVAGTANLSTTLVLADGEATLRGDRLRPREGRSVALPDDGRVLLQVFVDYGAGAALSYRVSVPVRADGGTVRALTPTLEACREPRRCGGEAAYVPGTHRPGVAVSARLRAGNATAAGPEAISLGSPKARAGWS